MGMRMTIALVNVLATCLISLTSAEETAGWRTAGKIANCAADMSSGAVAGGGFAGAAALFFGTPVLSTAAGGLLLGSMAGGVFLDGCHHDNATGSPPARGPTRSAAKQMLHMLRHQMQPKVPDPAVQEKSLDVFLQRLLPHSKQDSAASHDQHCNAQGSCMLRKYRNRWPNCKNLKCFSDLTLEDAFYVCLSHSQCDGISISSGSSVKERGVGCYKTACRDDGSNGYGTGGDDYWVKTGPQHATSSMLQLHAVGTTGRGHSGQSHDCNGQASCFVKKYERKWPNCENLNCFSNIKLKEAKASCLLSPACHGFSISAGISADGQGDGCFKTSCEEDSWNGYSRGPDDYWAKEPTLSAAGKGSVMSTAGKALVRSNIRGRQCNSHGACLEIRYRRRWPNCENLQCFSNTLLEAAKIFCLSHPTCDGFSMSELAMDGGHGNGCYKTRCTSDGWNGYEYGTDGYWAKVPPGTKTNLLASPALATIHAGHICSTQGHCMTKKYVGKWPTCNNLKCFSGLSLDAAMKECLSNPACNGFSISAGITAGPGSGCYKTSCRSDHDGWNGYETGQDDYWTKTNQQSPRRSFVESEFTTAVFANTIDTGSCNQNGACLEKRYERKWPNCINLYCFSKTELNDAKATCLSHPACHGFSISEAAMQGGRGDGCYKTSCEKDGWNGFSVGSDGYWAKVQTITPTTRVTQVASRCDQRSCMIKKYERKWPNCENLYCFSATDLEHAKAACLSQQACNGFSISTMAVDGGKGAGCYKTRCKKEEDLRESDFGHGQDGYWAKVSVRQAAKSGEARKQESHLDALLQGRIISRLPVRHW